MANETIETQIKQYFLGELDNDAAERIEERLFTDDEMLSDLESVEMGMIDAYVRNEMPSGERGRFERGYLVTPERRARLNDATAFHRELAAMRERAAARHDEKAGVWQRLFGGFGLSMPAMQFAAVAAVAILALSAAWFVYDSRRLRSELELAKVSLANSESELNDRLREKEAELQSRLAEQRGEDSETLSALQSEIDRLQRELDEARRNRPSNNGGITSTSPTIATVFLPVARGGAAPRPTVAVSRQAKVLNIRVPVESDGDIFDLALIRGGATLIKTTGVKPVKAAGVSTLTLSVGVRRLAEGGYTIVLRNAAGKETSRSFTLVFNDQESL